MRREGCERGTRVSEKERERERWNEGDTEAVTGVQCKRVGDKECVGRSRDRVRNV